MSSIYYKGQKYTGPTLDLGSGSLTTNNKTIVGAINELDAEVGSYTEGMATSTGDSTVSLAVRQYGRVITINGYVQATLTAGTLTNIATISGVTLPASTVKTLCGISTATAYDHPIDVAYLSISTAGVIAVRSNQDGLKYIYFTASYIS